MLFFFFLKKAFYTQFVFPQQSRRERLSINLKDCARKINHIQTAVFAICDSPLFNSGVKCMCATLPWHQKKKKKKKKKSQLVVFDSDDSINFLGPRHPVRIHGNFIITFGNSWVSSSQFHFLLKHGFLNQLQLSTSLFPHQLYISCSTESTLAQLHYYCMWDRSVVFWALCNSQWCSSVECRCRVVIGMKFKHLVWVFGLSS